MRGNDVMVFHDHPCSNHAEAWEEKTVQVKKFTKGRKTEGKKICLALGSTRDVSNCLKMERNVRRDLCPHKNSANN